MNNLKILSEQIQELRPLEGRTVRAWTIDPETGEKEEQEVPAFLFRGEARIWDTTFSSMYRFAGDERLSSGVRQAVISITKALDKALQSFGLHQMYSSSLLQHYGLPTELIDATSSLDIAASFATYKNEGYPGRIYAYDVERLRKNVIVIDLKRLHFAKRPRLQSGYCLFHRTEPDFKAKGLLEAIAAERLDFQGSDADIADFDKNKIIWGHPTEDPVSGLLNKILHDVVLSDISLPEADEGEAVRWVEEQIPWANVPMRFVDGEDGQSYLEPAWDLF